MDCSLPGSFVHGIFQARVLELGAIGFSNNVSSDPYIMQYSKLVNYSCVWLQLFVVVQSLSCVWLFVTLCPAAHLGSLSLTVSQSLLKLLSIELVMLSNHLIICHPLLLLPSIFPNDRVLSDKSALCIRWPKYWSFSFIINPSNSKNF